MGGASLVFMGVATSLLTIAIWPFLHDLVALMGARGQTLALSTRFLQIVFPSTPILALGMCTTGILRGVADARRAMYVTLGSALAAAILDPLLIFGLRPRSRRRGNLDGAGPVRDGRDRHSRRASHPRAGTAAGSGSAWASRAAVLLDRPAGGSHTTGNPCRQRLRHHRNGCLWRPGRCRLGDHRTHRAGRLRRHLRPFRRGRADPRAEFRSAPLRSHRLDDARQPYRHHRLCGDRLGTAGSVRAVRSPACSAPWACRAN